MTNWKLIKNTMTGETNVVWRELEDGRQESMLITEPSYLAWVAEGNVATPAEEQV